MGDFLSFARGARGGAGGGAGGVIGHCARARYGGERRAPPQPERAAREASPPCSERRS